MRRHLWLALVAVLALAAAGLAVGALTEKGIDAVAASFTAEATDASKTRTCTADGQTWRQTRGVYVGTSTGDARLAGKITIRTQATVNVTTGYGYTQGQLVVRDDDGKLKAKANLTAVTTEGGVLNGFLNGRVALAGEEDRSKHGGMLRANFTAELNAAGTSLSGQLGSGSGRNSAIVFNGTGCKKTSSPAGAKTRTKEGEKKRAEHKSARGEITAVSSTSITVGELTCSIRARLSERIARLELAVGTRVRIACVAHAGGWTLAKIERG